MAQTVDELIVKIRADMGQLKGQLRDLEKSTAKTGRQGGQNLGALGAGAALAGGSLKNLIGPAIGVAGVMAVLNGVRGVAAVGSGFEDLKDSLDTVFGSIEAGDRAFNRIINFAQTTPFQIETATQAFISLKSAGVEPTNEMLQTFADTSSVAVDQLGTFNALIRLVQRSAGGGLGLEELNMIADRGIDVFGGLKDELGLSRDEISEFGKTSEGAKTIVDALIRSLNKQFGGAMATKMDNLSTVSSNMTIAFRGLADEIFKSGIGDMLKAIALSMTDLANATAKFFREVRGEPTLADVGITTDDPEEQLDQIEDVILNLEARRERLMNARIFKDHQVIGNAQEMMKLTRQINHLMEVRNGLQNREVDEAEEIVGLTQDQVRLRGQFQKFLEDSVPEAEKLAQALIDIEQFNGLKDDKGNVIFSEDDITRIKTYIQSLIEAEGQQDNNTTSSLAMANAIAQASNSFGTEFANALLDGGNALQAFNDLARNIVAQIIATFMNLAVINPILNNLFAGVEGYTPAPTLTNASGGHYNAGQPLLVGERGPELMIPNTSGTIMNNMNTRNALGSSGAIVVNQSINFATGINATVRNEVTQLMPQIAEVTKSAILEESQRSLRFRGR